MENIYHDYWQQELMYQFLVEDSICMLTVQRRKQ